MWAFSRCFTIEGQKQSVTVPTIFVIYNGRFIRKLEMQKAWDEWKERNAPHRASMTWQCRTVLWASLWSSRSRWISPWTSSSGSTRLRFSQLSKPAGAVYIVSWSFTYSQSTLLFLFSVQYLYYELNTNELPKCAVHSLNALQVL